MRNLIWMLLVLLLVVPVTAESENPFSVTCFPGWGGRYRPLDWTPLEFGLSTQLTEPFDGVIHISVDQDSYHRLHVAHPVVLTPGMTTNLSLSTRIAYNASMMEIRLTDRKGRTRLREELGLWDYSNESQILLPVDQEDLFVGLVGRRSQGLSRLPQQAWAHLTTTNRETANGKIVIQEKRPQVVPWDWTGFDGLDLLILNDPDFSVLRAEQLQAMVDWVRQGGRVLIVLGRNAFDTHSDLARQLPVNVGALQELQIASDDLSSLDVTLSGEQTVVGYPLETRMGATLLHRVSAHGSLIYASCLLGFGRLGMVGVDPGSLSEQSEGLWLGLINALLDGEQASDARTHRRRAFSEDVVGKSQACVRSLEFHGLDPQEAEKVILESRRSHQYELLNDQQGLRETLDYLYGIEELRPMHIGWVVLLLVLLAILLGPVDYLILKKLDRQPLTWLTSLGWIALFTIGAYYGVQALRAGDLQIRTVSVIDAVQGQNQGCATYLSGIFAPKSDDYRFEQMQEDQWFAGVSPTQDVLHRYQRGYAQRHVYCSQHNGNNWIGSLPVNIWTMQSVQMENAREPVGVQASVTLNDDQIHLTLSNQTGRRVLRGCLLLSDGRGMGFDEVEDGERLDLAKPIGPLSGWSGLARNCQGQRRLPINRIFSTARAQQRSQSMVTYLEQGAAVLCVELDEGPTPYQLQQSDAKTHHLSFVRMVVFPNPQ